MAFYVSVPRDLSRVKTKVFFNLTKRQIICFGLAACIGIPVFFLLKDKAGTSIASLAMIFTMLPLFFMAMYEKNGMPVEDLLRLFYESRIRRPKQRPYKTDNYYTALEREEKARKEIDGAFCGGWRTLMRFTADSLRSKSHILDYVSMVKGNPAKRAPLTHNPGYARWHTSRSKA